jgi:class 3 adenylate cyclase/predicted ATPase
VTFEEILDQALAMLQRRGRVTYRTLKRQFQLDDEALADLKAEIITGQRLAVDEDEEVLVWTGDVSTPPAPVDSPPPRWEGSPADQRTGDDAPRAEPRTSDAERRQLTVLFCDLVDSTVLASQLDPEEWREVVRAYQATCAEVVQRWGGYIAQYLGDGLLIYCGYPQAHEDDAQRAVQTGLGLLDAIGMLNTRLEGERGIRLAIRVGIHTGVVVVGAMGGGDHQERLALGDTPHVAARLQGMAEPDTITISAATSQLIQGYFVCEDLGSHLLKGITAPQQVYRVLRASGLQGRLEVTTPRGLTPLVGRESEVTLLLERWQQVKEGHGQVMLLSGEAGIGKSRLIQVLKDHVAQEPCVRLECHSSAYFQHTPFYPITEVLQRTLDWQPNDTPATKLSKLEHLLRPYRLAVEESVPLVAALLSLPLPQDAYPPLTLSPQRQRQKTLETLVAWLLAHAKDHPALLILEDLHWTDSSTLALLDLLLDSIPATGIFTILTCRPPFQHTWGTRAYLTQMTVNRVSRNQVERMAAWVAGGKRLPADVLQQIVDKTDGVPLYVEEITKTVLESGVLQEVNGQYEVTGALSSLAIPATLQGSLMARLDRLVTAKALAQYAAVIGRHFSYALLQAVTQLDEATLQRELARLMAAELVYQRGVLPQATYMFKHALVTDIAYQSLLRSTRQQYHHRIAQVMEERFPEMGDMQPELLAHHYTEAGLHERATFYWQRAGERAVHRSAYVEAIAHLTKGLEVLQTLPDTPEHTRHELDVLVALGVALTAIRGQASPDVERVYARACELGRQEEKTPQLFLVLFGLWGFYEAQGELQTARELAEQLLTLAQHLQDSALLLEAHHALGATLFWRGDVAPARAHVEQGVALYTPLQHRSLAFLYGEDPGVVCRSYAARALWFLGYPDQALKQSHEALASARELAHPFSLAYALTCAAALHQFRREGHATQAQAEAAITLSIEQGLPYWVAWGTVLQGWALAAQGHGAEGLEQIRQGLAAYRATGAELLRPYFLALLAEASGDGRQTEEGLSVLAEALALGRKHGVRFYEAALYRLKGELLLQSGIQGPEPGVFTPDAKPQTLDAQAEACFLQALDVARRQQAKSWELRAAMSLSRLWQQQGKRAEARELLAPIHSWFTEGFDTPDLQEAKTLLEDLGT